MNFSISDYRAKFSFGKNPEAVSIFFHLENHSIHYFYSSYCKNYKPKNDLNIFGISFFIEFVEFLAKLDFQYRHFNFDYFNNALRNKIEDLRFIFYSQKSDIELNLMVEKFSYYKGDYSKNNMISFLIDIEVTKEYESINYFIKNTSDFFIEVKTFLINFYDFVINENKKLYQDFKFTLNVIKKDFLFLKTTNLKTFSLYSLSIGNSTLERSEIGRNIPPFSPAGTCTFGKKIFINSKYTLPMFSLWKKNSIKKTFYHEVGHTIDRLYFDETILKNTNHVKINSKNKKLSSIVIKNYKQYNSLKYKLKISKKNSSSLDYYIIPKFQKRVIANKNEFKLHYDKFLSENYYTDNTKDLENLQPTEIYFKSKILDFSRANEESWSESFSFVFNWLKNGFDQNDFYAFNTRSYEHFLIKFLGESMLYILENIDWTKLGIRKSIYVKRKNDIKKLINNIQNKAIFKRLFYIKKALLNKKKYKNYNAIVKYSKVK